MKAQERKVIKTNYFISVCLWKRCDISPSFSAYLIMISQMFTDTFYHNSHGSIGCLVVPVSVIFKQISPLLYGYSRHCTKQLKFPISIFLNRGRARILATLLFAQIVVDI